jgi:hypothetical protein
MPPGTYRESGWRTRMRGEQFKFALIGAVLLAGSMILRGGIHTGPLNLDGLEDRRTRPDPVTGAQLIREDPESEKTLASLSVTFPRLTFGGMRGIVSSLIWIQAEDDKNERRWTDLETKYDLIGALQPYFASVYIYHSWNQAYNLSAQFQDEQVKYKWVLDGIVYLYKGDDFNPANSDLLQEASQLFSQKLGLAAERIVYRETWRKDLTRLHELEGRDLSSISDDPTVALENVRKIITHKEPRDGSNYFHVELLPDPSRRGLGVGWGISITDPRDPVPSKAPTPSASTCSRTAPTARRPRNRLNSATAFRPSISPTLNTAARAT